MSPQVPAMFRKLFETLGIIAALAAIVPAAWAKVDLSADDRAKIESAALRIGETVVDQGHDADDVRNVLTFYVKGEVAKAVQPDRPEAPLPASAEADVAGIVDDVMAHLNPPKPDHPQPVSPVKPASPPSPKPADPGKKPQQYVWVFVPFAPPQPSAAPSFAPAYAPAYAPLPGMAVLPGTAPTIHIKHRWFGHPDKVWYSRH
jgi:hypothetical protein